MPLMRSPDSSSTWIDQGSRPPSAAGLYCANAGGPVGHDREQPRPTTADPRPEAPVADVGVGLQPEIVWRHVPGGVLLEQGGQAVHVVLLEGLHVAGEQGLLVVVQRVGRRGRIDLARRERRPGALQRAVDRGDRRAEQLGDLVGLPVQDLAQDEHRPLPRRQVLERGDERQPDRLAGDGDIRGIAAGRDGPVIGDRLDPGVLGQRWRERRGRPSMPARGPSGGPGAVARRAC